MNDLLQMRIFGLLSKASQEVTNQEMKNAYAEFLEQIERVSYLFNIKLRDIHKKHENVICRKANKRTDFLDILRETIAKESKKKGYL